MSYGMFSCAGNVAVEAIVNSYTDRAEDHNELFDLVYRDLETLQTVSAFAEATDTEVREEVYQQCLREFPVLVFRSVRG